MKRILLSLILAGAVLVSFAGCGSPDTGEDMSTPDAESTSVSEPDVEPVSSPEEESEPVQTPEEESEPAPPPEEKSGSEPAPEEESEPASAPETETAPAPESEEDAASPMDDLIQLVEQALSQGDVNYTLSAESDGIVVSAWVEGFGDALSAAMESSSPEDKATLANGGKFLFLLMERNILELSGAAEYADIPVTMRILDDRNPEEALFVISDGEIVYSVLEN